MRFVRRYSCTIVVVLSWHALFSLQKSHQDPRTTRICFDIAELSMNCRVRFLLLRNFRQLPAVQDAFGGAPVLRTLKESQLLLHDLAAAACTSSRRTDEATRGSFASCSTSESTNPHSAGCRTPAWSSRTLIGWPSTTKIIGS